MSCPTELELSMYADGELAADDAARLDRHVLACAACRAAAGALSVERATLMAVLQHEARSVSVPRLRRPIGPRQLLSGGAVAAALCFAVALAWMDLADLTLPAGLAWLNPFDGSALASAAVELVSLILLKGNPMLTEAVTNAAAGVAFAFIAWAAFALHRRRGGTALLLTLALAAVALPRPSHALEFRQSKQLLTIPDSETIHDTLVATGETVAIDGTIDGDVIAAAKRVVVRGHVTGLLVTAAETVDIQGQVDGSLAGFGRTLEITRAHIGRNLYAFGQTVTLAGGAEVGANATVFAETADLSGSVGTDVAAFGRDLALSGSVARNFDAYGKTVTVLRPASVGGDVVAHVADKDNLRVAPDATVRGNVRTEIWQQPQGPRIERVPFLARQAVRFAAAFVAGLLVLWLLPSLRTATLENGADALITGGIGLLALICVPVLAVIVAVTIVGLPIALTGMALWAASVYFAKILLAYFLGRTILATRIAHPTVALSLAVGLILVLILANVPFVGGLLSFLMLLVGLGMILEVVYRQMHGRRAIEA